MRTQYAFNVFKISCVTLFLSTWALSADTQIVERECRLVYFLEGPAVGNVDLGSFNPGDTIKATLTVSNQGQVPINFKSVRASCGCMKVTPTSGKIPARSDFVFNVEIGLPSKPSELEYMRGFTGVGSVGDVFSVRLNYRQSGVVTFRSSYAHAEISSSSKPDDLILPFAYSEDLKEGDYSLELGGDLAKLEFEIDHAKSLIKIRFPSGVEGSGISGIATLCNKKNNYRSSLPISVMPRLPLKLFPAVLPAGLKKFLFPAKIRCTARG